MLELAMDAAQAWEQLGNAQYSGRLNMEGLHRLLLRAGYSEDAAHGAAMQRGWDRLNAGEVM